MAGAKAEIANIDTQFIGFLYQILKDASLAPAATRFRSDVSVSLNDIMPTRQELIGRGGSDCATIVGTLGQRSHQSTLSRSEDLTKITRNRTLPLMRMIRPEFYQISRCFRGFPRLTAIEAVTTGCTKG